MVKVPNVASFIINSLFLQDRVGYLERFLESLQNILGYGAETLYSASKMLSVDSKVLPYLIRSLGVPKEIVDNLSDSDMQKLLPMLIHLYKIKGVKRGYIPLIKAFIKGSVSYDEVYDFWWLTDEKALTEDTFVVTPSDIKTVTLYPKNYRYQVLSMSVWRTEQDYFRVKIKEGYGIKVTPHLHLLYEVRTATPSSCGVDIKFDTGEYLSDFYHYQKLNPTGWEQVCISLSTVYDPNNDRYISSFSLFDDCSLSNIVDVRNIVLLDVLSGRCYPVLAYRDIFISVPEDGEHLTYTLKSLISEDIETSFLNEVVNFSKPIGLSVEVYNMLCRYRDFSSVPDDLYVSDSIVVQNGELVFPESFSYNNLVISADTMKLYKIKDYCVSLQVDLNSNAIVIINLAKSSLFNYYSIIFDRANEKIYVYRYADGTSFLLVSEEFEFAGTTFRLSAMKDSSTLMVSVDGETVISLEADFISGYWEVIGADFALKELSVFQIPNLKEVM